MLQILINGQKSIQDNIASLKEETEKGFEEVNERLDTIGSSVAHLEDDTPTEKEFRKLKKKVARYHPPN